MFGVHHNDISPRFVWCNQLSVEQTPFVDLLGRLLMGKICAELHETSSWMYANNVVRKVFASCEFRLPETSGMSTECVQKSPSTERKKKKQFSNVVQFIGMRLLSGNLFSSAARFTVVSSEVKEINVNFYLAFFLSTRKFSVWSFPESAAMLFKHTMPYNDPLMCLYKWCSAIRLDIQASDE